MQESQSKKEALYVMLRMEKGMWHTTEMTPWQSVVTLASLSVDPRTMHELQHAYSRYERERAFESFRWVPGWPNSDVESDAKGQGSSNDQAIGKSQWLMIDLIGLSVLSGNGYDLPQRDGTYDSDEPESQVSMQIAYLNVPPYWNFESIAGGLPQKPFRELPLEPRPEVRAVLYGRPLVEYIAERTLRASVEGLSKEKRKERHAKSPLQKLTKQIHSDWLMTPRADLGDLIPRRFLHGGDSWIEREMQNRQHQWCRENRAPVPPERDTYLYQFGIIGPQERMIYFDLCRALIQSAWALITGHPKINIDELADELAACRQEWLRQPYEMSAETPTEIIEMERRRLPMISKESHADCDCPICQQMKSGAFGPDFVGYDGYHLDAEQVFAFSNTEDYEDWKFEYGEYDEAEEDDSDAVEDERPKLEQNPLEKGTLAQRSMDEPRPTLTSSSTPWNHTFVNWKLLGDPHANPTVFALAIAFATAELEMDLATLGPSSDGLIRSLSEARTQLKSAVQTHDDSLIRHAQQCFTESLDEIALHCPASAAKVEELKHATSAVLNVPT